MKLYYAVTAPTFQINRGFWSKPQRMYIGSTFTNLIGDSKQSVTVCTTEEAAKQYAQSIKNNDFAV